MAVCLQTQQFEAKLKKAVQEVKLILDSQRTAQVPSAVHHEYQDKFHLVEKVSQLTLASQVNCLSTLGLRDDALAQACRRAHEGAQVSLRFKSQEKCSFLREETRQEEDPRKVVNEVSMGGLSMGITSKTVTKVTEFFWKLEVSYELEVYRGVGAESSDRLQLLARPAEEELKTSSKVLPHPESNVACRQEVNITCLLRHLNGESSSMRSPTFRIDRGTQSCKSPRRNAEVEELVAYFTQLAQWAARVGHYLVELQGKVAQGKPPPSTYGGALLVPSLPLFAKGAAADHGSAATGELVVLGEDAETKGESPTLAASECNLLLSEEARRLAEKRQNIIETIPDRGVFTAAEAYLAVCLAHCNDVLLHWNESMAYVEQLLRDQLIAAIGKEVTPEDFGAYMRFHYRKLFLDAYQPQPFSFAVRRSGRHAPEGMVSIEEEAMSVFAPINSMVALGRAQRMTFALNASTTVSFSSSIRLHACLLHRFSGQSGGSLSLVSRARQFSSFIVLVGRVLSATSFDPKYAMLLQNKDELKIPLEMSTIPTPKEFKDAIESLSPEMRSFAKAFRAMQLESTLRPGDPDQAPTRAAAEATRGGTDEGDQTDPGFDAAFHQVPDPQRPALVFG
ncbi:unnamed protein product [Durusdinium trenchii]|uniref:Uncharacterized protein n=1 Tax=Durusdinium trenchii TaxID=1381693 RepID=A0ABP0PQI9_9DINO